MRRDGRLRQWRKDRQGGDYHQCERLVTRVQGPLSAEKAEDGGARGLSFDVVI